MSEPAKQTTVTTKEQALNHLDNIWKQAQTYGGKPGFNPFFLKAKLDDARALLNSKDPAVSKVAIETASKMSFKEADITVSYEKAVAPPADAGSTIVKPPAE